MKKIGYIFISFIISMFALVLFFVLDANFFVVIFRILNFIVFFVLGYGLFVRARVASYLHQFLRRNVVLIGFCFFYGIAIFFDLFVFWDRKDYFFELIVCIVRFLFLLVVLIDSVVTFEIIFESIKRRPALSIVVSFFVMIVIGSLLLMLPFATCKEGSLPLVDAFFTSTSAVCVTGLIVVDTSVMFTLVGKIIILILIQTGGLGIMMLAYFSMLFLGNTIGFQEKQRLLLVVGDSDMSSVGKSLRKIVSFTFFIEGIGAALLFVEFGRQTGWNFFSLFSAIFHSVSAFCNAGFSVYSNSLEGFSNSPSIIFTISFLIILGGLSFPVIFNIARVFNKRRGHITKLALNSRVVVFWSILLLVCGFVFFYALEHGNVLKGYSTGVQYLSSFFQSITLRTAGFNSVPFSALRMGTLVVMCFFMFVGGASGGTAGGIKVNTVAVIFAYFKSLVRGCNKINLYGFGIAKTDVLKAFAIFLYGIFAVFLGVTALALSHKAGLGDIIFEAVSAFGTVGLSTGLTSRLNGFGKLVIIFLMFNGRLGPLTILTSLLVRENSDGSEYPEGRILVG